MENKLSDLSFDDQLSYAIALSLQDKSAAQNYNDKKFGAGCSKYGFLKTGITDPSWDVIDPNPDIHQLFSQFNKEYFYGKLDMVEVKWSPQMTLCAGVCSYDGRGGLCSVRLSKPLLQYRPRSDLVETLLHEMIHAYLFVTHNNKDRDGHGPQFQFHMRRINKLTGANITIYHTFHDEVEVHRKHWWRCNGSCRNKKPFYGFVKRSKNRAPSKNDFWWFKHEMTCGGKFEKVKEPEGYKPKSATGKSKYKTNINLENIKSEQKALKSASQKNSAKNRLFSKSTNNRKISQYFTNKSSPKKQQIETKSSVNSKTVPNQRINFPSASFSSSEEDNDSLDDESIVAAVEELESSIAKSQVMSKIKMKENIKPVHVDPFKDFPSFCKTTSDEDEDDFDQLFLHSLL